MKEFLLTKQLRPFKTKLIITCSRAKTNTRKATQPHVTHDCLTLKSTTVVVLDLMQHSSKYVMSHSSSSSRLGFLN